MLNQENKTYLDQQRKGRLMVLCMLVFFMTPILVVIAMYQLDWRPQGSSVGELVIPPRPLSMNQNLKMHDGNPLSANVWKDKWTMVYIATACESECHKKLHDMRQIHVSLYKEIPRMQRMLITHTQNTADLIQKYPELLIINQPNAEISELSEQFNLGQHPALTADRIYLIDPLGHFMMSFSPTTQPALIRKDITRLMKYSWAG